MGGEPKPGRSSFAWKGAAWGVLLGVCAALVTRHMRFPLGGVVAFAGVGGSLGAAAGLLWGEVFLDRAREWWEEWPPRRS